MPTPAATAAAPATRFIDIRVRPFPGFGPDNAKLPCGQAPKRRSCGRKAVAGVWDDLRYGQVTSISNDFVICFGSCGLLMSRPVAVPLIA